MLWVFLNLFFLVESNSARVYPVTTRFSRLFISTSLNSSSDELHKECGISSKRINVIFSFVLHRWHFDDLTKVGNDLTTVQRFLSSGQNR